MEKSGFKSGQVDTNVYFQFGENGSIEIARWYVDNGLLAANSTKSMDQMITNICGSFDIQDLGEPDHLLRVKISRVWDLGTIHISQLSFINIIARGFNISSGRSVMSPMDPSVDLYPASNMDKSVDVPYASLIGSINYCAITTWPDISYTTNKCAQFTSKPTLIY